MLFKKSPKLEELTIDNCKLFDLNGQLIKCKVLKVYDGDTVTLGWIHNKKAYKKSCRLYGIDTPELKSSNPREVVAGKIARDFLKDLIVDTIVKVHFLKNDKYGRPLVNIYMKKSRRFLLGIRIPGKFNCCVNKLVIENGHAYEYFGKTKIEFGKH